MRYYIHGGPSARVTQIAHYCEGLWGRMASCGRLVTGLFPRVPRPATVVNHRPASQAAPPSPNHTGQDIRRSPLAGDLNAGDASRLVPTGRIDNGTSVHKGDIA